MMDTKIEIESVEVKKKFSGWDVSFEIVERRTEVYYLNHIKGGPKVAFINLYGKCYELDLITGALEENTQVCPYIATKRPEKKFLSVNLIAQSQPDA